MSLSQCKDAAAAAVCKRVIVVQHVGGAVDWDADRDRWVFGVRSRVPVVSASPQSYQLKRRCLFYIPLGQQGRPKGLKHTTGGYMVYAAMTHEYVFDYREGDIYWCTADVGVGDRAIAILSMDRWLMVQRTLMFEGVPNYPDNSRFGRVIEKAQSDPVLYLRQPRFAH